MLRRAKSTDVSRIKELIDSFANEGAMLPRSLNELYESLRDFWVYEEEGRIIACGALHPSWEDLAEVKSLAVDRDRQRRGIGAKILQACLSEAGDLGIRRIFALTYQPHFFRKQGFRIINKSDLPHKIWSECIKCPHFPDCREIPLLYEVGRTDFIIA